MADSRKELEEVLRQLDDRTNQTWAVRRARWARMVREQDAEIAALKDELSDVLGDWNALVKASGSPTNGGAIGHVTALRAEAERLRVDAERYRWLRQLLWTGELNQYSMDRQWLWTTRFSTPAQTHELDAAIDAAMREEGGR